ncbi:MAG: hypothetical protein IT553_02735 [Sphingomonadaceae bacterium]|nr:hypothetical protein [Sphingomonadaceae bacterium]
MLRQIRPWQSATLVWLLTLIILLIWRWHDVLSLSSLDPDDALRMVQVRDLLHGQAWWDISQHRINPTGGGGLMHWSRIVDAPLAFGIWALTPIAGAHGAQILVFGLWPMCILLPLLLLMARVGMLLDDRRIAHLAAPIICTNFMVLYQFVPIRVDHHGWQIMLQAAMLCAILSPRPWHTLWGGVAGAVLLAISLEGLPVITLFAGILAIAWAWHGDGLRRQRLFAYLAAIAISAPILQFVTRGPAGIVSRWCDALSLAWMVPLLVAAVLVPALYFVTRRWGDGRIQRGAILAVAAGVASGAMLYVAPECRAGPFGQLDPLVHDYWYAHVREGLPVWNFIDGVMAFSLVPTILGLVGSLLAWRAASGALRARWLVILAAVVGSGAVSILVLRTQSAAHVMALPGTAWLLIHGWQRARALHHAGPRIAASLACLALFPPTASAPVGMLIDALSPSGAHASDPIARACITPASVTALNALSPQLIFTPLDIAPGLLERTPHAVVATGHHRNNHIMAKVIRAFISPAEQAQPLVRASGANMLVICPSAQEIRNFADAPGGDNLTDDLLAGRTPDWLSPYPLPAASPLRAWWVRPQPAR